MGEADPLAPLLAALRDLMAWLRAEGVSGVVIGGVAASILGRPRATRDVDMLALLEEGRWAEFLAAGKQFGFMPRDPDALAFARRARVLLMRHEPSGIDVDIVFGALPFEEEVVGRARSISLRGVDLQLPTPEDLVIMKAVANRPRDVVDIEAVLDACPKLDLRRVRRWVREFAVALEAPGIPAGLEAIIARRKRAR